MQILNVIPEGCITLPKGRNRLFRTIGFLGTFYGFFSKTKGFRTKVYDIFQNDTPLDSNMTQVE